MEELVGLCLGFGCCSLVGRDEVIFTKRASALTYWTIVNVGAAARRLMKLEKRIILSMVGKLHLFEAMLSMKYLDNVGPWWR